MPRSNPSRLALALAAIVSLSAFPLKAQESVYGGAFPGLNGTLSNLIDFEQQSGKGAAIANFFRNWEDGNGSLGFPTAAMSGFRNHGSIPMISWQPRGHRADSHYKLANILNGDFDNFIRNWALSAKAWGHPFFLRFAHEMNGNWYPWCAGVNGNTAQDYIAAWRHVRDIFTRNGVTNVTWVWCPNTSYSGSTPINQLYPGDNYVDWTSADVYNRITNNWGHFSVRGGPTLGDIIALAPGKPIMIAETGCHRDDDKAGTPPGSKAQWYRTVMKDYLKNSMPRIKAWVYFNGNNPDGNNWRIDTSADVLAAYRESIGLSYYSDNKYGSITDSPIRPLPNDAKATDTMAPFVSIDLPRVNFVHAGMTNEIRTHASDKSGITKVEYSVNGVLQHTETLFPYQYFWPTPSGPGLSYTIACKAFDGQGNTATSTIQVLSVNPPPAITGVAATDGAHTDKIRVTWNSASGANGYDIWRNTTNSTTGAVKLNTDPVTATTYDDTTPEYTTSYHYWVCAVADSGPGLFGSPDAGHRSLPAAPPAPAGLHATDGLHNLHTLVAWNNTSGATGYQVWRNTVNNSSTASLIATITQNSHQDTDVPYAVNHYYWAKAVNDGGTSAFSNVGAGYRGTLPTISDITNRTINQDSDTGAISFTIGDVHTPASELQLSATSSDTALLPAGNIVFGGSGASRTFTATPAPGQSGTATVIVTVTDADGGQNADAFILSVNARPVVSPISDVSIPVNTSTGNIAFTVTDLETASTSLTLTASSSNTTLVPNNNIALGGGGQNRTIALTPATGIAGTAGITVTVSDGLASSSETFYLSVLDNTRALWTAATATTHDWSHGSNWLGGFPPAGGPSTSITFLTGSPLPQGTVVSNQNLASPFILNSLMLSGGGPESPSGAVRISGGSLRFQTSPGGSTPVIHLAADNGAGLIYQLASPLILDNTLTIDGGGTASFVIEGPVSGSGGITKSGTADLTISGDNSHSGNTIVRAAGTLKATHPNALGSAPLQINTGAVSPLIRLHIDGDGNDGVIAMPVGFAGNSNITTTIDVSNNGGANTGNIIRLNGPTTGWGNNATLNVTGSHGYGLHIARLRSTGGISGTETFNPTSAPLTIGEYQGANNATTLALNGSHTGNAITGPIVNGSSVVSLSKNQSGTWLLGGANTFTGTTFINGGTLAISNNTALGGTSNGTTVSGNGGGVLELRGGVTAAEPITLNGRSSGEHLLNGNGTNTLTGAFSLGTGGNAYFIRSASGKLVIATPVAMIDSTANKILHVTGDGDIGFSGGVNPGSGALGISKTGTGTLLLTGSADHNGTTTVSGGTLVAACDLTTTSALTITTGGRFSGNGNISAPTVIGGVHAPGMSAGSQTFTGPLSYEATSRIEWELAADTTDDGSFDSIIADETTIESGAAIDLVFNAPGSSVDFTAAFWQQPRSWSVVTANSLTGSFTLGSVGTDSFGRSHDSIGSFTLHRVGSSVMAIWTPDTPSLAWKTHWFGEEASDPGIAGDLADPDGDGIPNLVEYALGAIPTEAAPSGIRCETENGELTMTYTLLKAATDITVNPEWSTTLDGWSTTGITREVIADDGTLQTIRATVPMTGEPRILMRLRVTRL